MKTGATLEVADLTVQYGTGSLAVRPIEQMSFMVNPGRLALLLGPSGSGKTTLLSALGAMLTPQSGSIRLGDLEVTALRESEVQSYRRDSVGFVFQSFNLIPALSARDNVALPLLLAGVSRPDALRRAESLLAGLELEEHAHRRPAQLSGGQKQRVAIARALVHDPPLLLADEPTANLDHVQTAGIIGVLNGLRDDGRAVVVSSHDARLLPIADEIIRMQQTADDPDGPPQEVRYEAGESIYEQGDWGPFVYVIEEGEVDLIRVTADGHETHLATLGLNQHFGELGPILGLPRWASARARTPVVLTAFGVSEFRKSKTAPWAGDQPASAAGASGSDPETTAASSSLPEIPSR